MIGGFARAFGSVLVAVPPEPGLSITSQTLSYGAQTKRALLNSRSAFGFNVLAIHASLTANHTFEQPVVGRHLRIGAALPAVTDANLNTPLQLRAFGTFSSVEYPRR